MGPLWAPDAADSKVRHEFYVSTTELRVDAENDRVTGVMQVFPDDWERAMNILLEGSGHRYIELAKQQQDSLHAVELQRTFRLYAVPEGGAADVSGPLRMQFVGSEQSAEYTTLYFYFQGLPREGEERNWHVNAWTLSEIYSNQENIITFYDRRGKRRTNSCRSGNDYYLILD